MIPGKPPGGFKVIVSPPVQAMVDDLLANHPEDGWRWTAVLARLSATGHIDGMPIGSHGSHRADTYELAKWKISLVWRVFHGEITILSALM